ncbi:DMT family transporter [Aliibacillus thermotolerans]|uniref:DMT family transporter n=1 Tax=Aliibacillus thermotolerans TaxID=1834418 RepID=A0ABW0UBA3_9BACI|nr:EamA family transporter [Aliibacillus thermotolerans]MDA3130518.1 EamA family transporter [Aliibacillus thermotolerans]
MTKKQAYLLAAIGAALWGIIGYFVQGLNEAGFTPWQIVAIRVVFSAIILLCFLAIHYPELLKIQRKDIVYFIGTGIVSFVFFNWCYFTVMEATSLSLAVVLLYTGPLFVTIFSRFLFREILTPRKISALIFTFIGCAFTVGWLPYFQMDISFSLLMIGIGSGFFYSLYTIFGKYASRSYHSLTITTYSFVCASVLMIPTSGLVKDAAIFLKGEVLFYAIGLALFPTVLGYILYTKSLSYIESSRASILTTIEPAVAILTGVMLFGDAFTSWQLFGMILVLSSVFLIAERKKRE